MSERKQYFMYGVLVSFNSYLDIRNNLTLEDVLKQDDDLQGIFTGRDGDFMIVGKILKTIVGEDKEPHVIPEISDVDMLIIETMVNKKYGIYGDFYYYFIKK